MKTTQIVSNNVAGTKSFAEIRNGTSKAETKRPSEITPEEVLVLLGIRSAIYRDPSIVKHWATSAQKKRLMRHGVDSGLDISENIAGKILGVLDSRHNGGLASICQVLWLTKCGVDPVEARETSKDDASVKLDRHFGEPRTKTQKYFHEQRERMGR
jgi:hypothetical protein